MSLALVPAARRLLLSALTSSSSTSRHANQKVVAGRVVDAGQMMRHVRLEMFGEAAEEWKGKAKTLDKSYSWLSDPKLTNSEKAERKRITIKLQNMCITEITLSMVKRYQFLVQFLGDESLVTSGLGRKYLIHSQLTRQLHDDFRHLRLLNRTNRSPASQNPDLQQLQQRLHQKLLNVRQAFVQHTVSSGSEFESEMSTMLVLTSGKESQKPGCLISFLSQQMSAFSGRKVTQFQIRSQLEQHPFWRRCHTSVSHARDMLLFLAKEKSCSPAQILAGIYVVLYDRRVVARSMSHVPQDWWQHPRLMDLLLYDAERRCGRLSSRDLFGSAVFATEKTEDLTQLALPYPHSLPSLPLLFQKGILRPDEE